MCTLFVMTKSVSSFKFEFFGGIAMPELNIVSISDMHFKKDTHGLEEKIRSICRVVELNTTEGTPLVFEINGDVAFSGQTEEYQVALDFVQELKTKFVNASFIVIPGNHDCDFSKVSDTRKNLIHNYSGESIDGDLWDVVSKPLSNYYSFKENVESSNIELQISGQSRLTQTYEISTDFGIVAFETLNTAWDSQLHEIPGSMKIPYQLDLKKSMLGKPVRIVLMHHPVNWFVPEMGRSLRNKLMETADIFITGHEHIESSSQTDGGGENIVHYEADVFNDNYDEANSGFDLISIQRKNTKLSISNEAYRWKQESSVYESVSRDTRNINYTGTDLITAAGAEGAMITPAFSKTVDEMGIPPNSSLQAIIKQEDLFVFPEVKDNFAKKPNSSRVDFKEIIGDIINRPEMINLIEGSRESGKTILGRRIFREAVGAGKMPLLINFTSSQQDLSNVRKLQNNFFKNEYDHIDFEKFRQFPIENKLLLIDGWDNLEIGSSEKKEFLDKMRKEFTSITVISSDTPRLQQDVIAIRDLVGADSKFSFWSIQKFGRNKREELIRKWIRTEKKYLDESPDSIDFQVTKIQQKISDILGDGYVPQVPMYILIILRSIDDTDDIDRFKDQGNGYYYELLIKNALFSAESRLGSDKYGELLEYLTNLAFFMFVNGLKSLDYSGWLNFHDKLLDEYGLDQDDNSFQKYSHILIASGLVKMNRVDERVNYTFSYLYVYYYFVAQYLSSHIGDDETKDVVSFLINNSNFSMNASILIFLVYLSHDKFILRTLIDKSNGILQGVPELKLESDVSQINELIDAVPNLVVWGSESAQENRARANKARDNYDDVGGGMDHSSENTLSSRSSKLVEIEQAYKLSEVIGQILKNYSGIIQKQLKSELLNSAYDVSLRAGYQMISLVQDEIDDLINFVSDKVNQDKNFSKKTDSEKRTLARKFVYDFCEMICEVVIRKTIADTGTASLKPIYGLLLDSDLPLSKRVIIIGTKIQAMHYRPQSEEITKFFDSVSGNVLVHSIIKHFAIDFVYFYSVSKGERQAIADKFGFKYSVSTRKRIQDRK